MPAASPPSGVRPPHVALLVAVTAVGPLALNIFVPSMPGLVRVFDTDYATVQLTLTLYLVGVAAGQLIYGPLSDRFGRRPLLLAGLGFFVAASVLCALADSVGLLIAGRILQALGGCAGMVLSRAIVRDVYDRDRSASVLAYITMAMAVAPALAPALGGFLEAWTSWRVGFVLLAAVGGATLAWSLAALHETHHTRLPLPGPGSLAVIHLDLLRKPAFLGFALTMAFGTASFFGFLAGAPYLVIDRLERPASEYGALFLLISLGFMLGSFIAGRLSVRLGTLRMIALGMAAILAGLAPMLALALGGVFTSLAIFGPMALIALGNGIVMPNAVAAAVSVNPQVAGTASGLLGFLQMLVGAGVTVVVGHLDADTQLPMVAVMAACIVLAMLAYRAARRAVRRTEPAVLAAGARPGA